MKSNGEKVKQNRHKNGKNEKCGKWKKGNGKLERIQK